MPKLKPPNIKSLDPFDRERRARLFHRDRRWPNLAIASLYVLPALAALGFIARFSVDLPYVDSFLLIYTFDDIALGDLTFSDLWILHNEHRIVLLRFVASALAFLSGWNTHVELVTSWILAVVSFVGLCSIAARTQPDSRDSSDRHWPNLVTGLLMFSLVQYENWLWGFQIAWLWIVTCLVLAIALIVQRPRPDRLDRGFWLAALLCGFASVSSAHGLLTWLSIAPCILFTAPKLRASLVPSATWLGLTIAAFAVYLHDYETLESGIDRRYAFGHPVAGLRYFFTLLGRGIAGEHLGSALAFGLLTGGVAIAVGLWFWFDRSVRARLAPWISLGMFAVGFSAMTTIGRTSLGIQSVLASRYTTIAVLATIAIVQIGALYAQRLRLQAGFRVACSILAAFSIYNSIAILPTAADIQQKRERARLCLTLIDAMQASSNRCLSYVFPNPKTLKNDLAVRLDRLGFYEFERDLEFVAAPDISHGLMDTPGKVSARAGETVTLSGWAILPDRQRPPEWVFLEQGDRREFFAEVRVDRGSPDLVEHFQNAAYDRARWSVSFPAELLSEPVTTVRAWAYDAEGDRFVRLDGAIEVDRLDVES
ncbi:MAG: hypothetical protein ACFB9N_17890 [Geitlerinemataceae cyanobacterium]